MVRLIAKIALLALMLLISHGCALTYEDDWHRPMLTGKAYPYRMNNIVYGESLESVNEKLHQGSKPLFRFRSGSDDFAIYLVIPRGVKAGYCFMYKSGDLFSVFTVDQGRDAWKDYFGEHEKSVPDPVKFSEMVKHFEAIRLDVVNYEFDVDSGYEYERDAKEVTRLQNGGISGQAQLFAEAGVYYGLLWPPAFYISGAGIGLMAVDAIRANTIYRDIKIEEQRLEEETARLASEWNDVSLKLSNMIFGATPRQAISELGSEDAVAEHEDQQVYIFNKYFTVLLGFQNNELEWIAFDYDPRLTKRGRSGDVKHNKQLQNGPASDGAGR